GADRQAIRRDHPGGGGPARAARVANARRRSLWAGPGATDRGRRADQGDLRADTRRRRYRLVRRRSAREDRARGRRGKSLGGRRVGGGGGGGRTDGRIGGIRGPATRRAGP